MFRRLQTLEVKTEGYFFGRSVDLVLLWLLLLEIVVVVVVVVVVVDVDCLSKTRRKDSNAV